MATRQQISFGFFVEHDAQPAKFSSMPETMWWSVATLTTVGYGDVFPIATLGKTLTAFISKEESSCPHCGKAMT